MMNPFASIALPDPPPPVCWGPVRMEPVSIGACKDCIFFDEFEDGDHDGYGECRRRAPLGAGPAPDHEAIFPVTDSTDWCGEFAPAAEQAPAPEAKR